MKIDIKNNIVAVTELEEYSLALTLDCGQAFRWVQIDDNSFSGVLRGKSVTLTQPSATSLIIEPCSEDDVSLFLDYFDFSRNYSEIKSQICCDEIIKKAVDYAGGIRILKQEPWEALCSFILSQNNNIKRIKGIVKSLCECFGQRLEDGAHSFPTAEKLALLTPEDLAPIKSGFRAKYVIDGAKKVVSGEISFEYLKTAPLDKAREHLKQIKGVGDKVAECVLLYGLNRLDAFPIDVWIKRALDEGYSGGMPQIPTEYMGVAQQYIFHYIRSFGKLNDL